MFDAYYEADLADDLKRKRFSIRVKWRPVGALLPRLPVSLSTTLEQVDAWRQDTFLLEQAKHESGEPQDRLFP
ncbi:hypothetical protein ASF56_23810 [Methylobacterium sp. Leaf122]|nr:hypothetical protein ASF56_23810 [Methylobacterium sp. Leaf122]